MMKICILPQSGPISAALYGTCLAALRDVTDFYRQYGVQSVSSMDPAESGWSVDVLFTFASPNGRYGWSQIDDDGRRTVIVAATKLNWWRLARSLVAQVTAHEFGHQFGLDHCDDPACLMTRVDIAGWRSVWAWVSRGGTLYLCDKHEAALVEGVAE